MTRRILAIEDQEDNRRILRDLLTSAGYEMIVRTPPRILIVDDNSDNLDIFQARLAVHGDEILTPANGEKALALSSETLPDLILMDVMMPKMDGIDNNPLPCPDPGQRAVQMAVAMRQRAGELAGTWRKRGHQLDLGVGISSSG